VHQRLEVPARATGGTAGTAVGTGLFEASQLVDPAPVCADMRKVLTNQEAGSDCVPSTGHVDPRKLGHGSRVM
jgi:hypothetical protein